MTQVVYGTAGDKCGVMRGETRAWATPTAELRTHQPSRIPVNLGHIGPPIGRVSYMELGPDSRLWLVAQIDDRVQPVAIARVGTELRHVPVSWFWSLERYDDPDWGIEIVGVALTDSPARGLAAQPVIFRDGTANEAARNAIDRHERNLLRRAANADCSRRPGAPLVIAGHQDAQAESAEYASWLHEQSYRDNPHDVRPELGDVERGPRGRILRVS